MSGFRGYVASRPVRGEFTPQHVQNLVLRDYAERNQLEYRLSATEYSMPGCFMILEGALDELESPGSEIAGLILFSLFMLPDDTERRRAIYRRALARSAPLHFALENLCFSEAIDVDRLEDMFAVESRARRAVSIDEVEGSRRCPLCGGPPAAVAELACAGITSDVKPWPRIAPLCACSRCGAVYKDTGVSWQKDAAAIYADYSAYHLAEGAERKVPDHSSLSPRSKLLADFAASHHALPDRGRLLDVGCGNGAFLAAFASVRADWQLTGIDHSDSGADMVRAIGAEFICGDVTAIDAAELDLISLVHVLEHVPDPIDWLSHLAGLLSPGGAILVDCPDHRRNPFDLAVADHVIHCDGPALRQIAARAGLAVIAFDSELIGKEVVALLVPGPAPLPPPEVTSPDLDYLDRLATWLENRFTSRLGILGTGIAATWTAGVLGSRVTFFVDEDPDRQSREYLGVPVIGPAEIDAGETVFVAQPPALSVGIAQRLGAAHPDVSWLTCPALDDS